MASLRIALANLAYPSSREESVQRAIEAVREAGERGVDVIAFPENYIPGYRTSSRQAPPPDAEFLERAWSGVEAAARTANVAVVLGTERVIGDQARISTLIIDRDGTRLGFQDKVQLDPSEEPFYSAGTDRQVFTIGPPALSERSGSNGLTFGVSICHEGWRYPETVRWAARRGAHVVFHPHFHEAEPGSFRPSTFADPANTFHEKALLCRAAENTCFVASTNYASEGSPTTSVVVRPDGSVLAYQPYGQAGLLIAELDLAEATRLLAMRCKNY